MRSAYLNHLLKDGAENSNLLVIRELNAELRASQPSKMKEYVAQVDIRAAKLLMQNLTLRTNLLTTLLLRTPKMSSWQVLNPMRSRLHPVESSASELSLSKPLMRRLPSCPSEVDKRFPQTVMIWLKHQRVAAVL